MGILAGRSILVVEDEMLVLMSIETMLQDLGSTRIESTATVAGALTLVKEQPFDAAMLDINLGGEISYPVADALIAAGIPFVFSTGYGDHGVRADLADRPLLKKPYAAAQLTFQFARLLGLEHLPEAA